MRRGLTLVEVLVASTIALLVIGIASRLLVPALRAFGRGSAQGQLQSDITVAMARLESDLQAGSPEGTAFLSGSTATMLAIQPMDRPAPDGSPQWIPEMVVFTWQQSRGVLLRQVWTKLPDPLKLQATTPTKLTTLQLPLLAPGPTAMQLASGVTAFVVDSPLSSDRGLLGPLALGLSVTRPSGESMTVTRSVSMRNP